MSEIITESLKDQYGVSRLRVYYNSLSLNLTIRPASPSSKESSYIMDLNLGGIEHLRDILNRAIEQQTSPQEHQEETTEVLSEANSTIGSLQEALVQKHQGDLKRDELLQELSLEVKKLAKKVKKLKKGNKESEVEEQEQPSSCQYKEIKESEVIPDETYYLDSRGSHFLEVVHFPVRSPLLEKEFVVLGGDLYYYPGDYLFVSDAFKRHKVYQKVQDWASVPLKPL